MAEPRARCQRAGQLITVGAGCILQPIQDAAERVDRLFPLSLGAKGSCQTGGDIAINDGGTAVLRYSPMCELAPGLEVVLPDGFVLHGPHRPRRNATFDPQRDLEVMARTARASLA